LITILSGGVGGARFSSGIVDVAPPGEDVVIVANTADDDEFYGLYVSPDIDTILYTLAGIGDWTRGWGIKDDTFNCNEMLGRLGVENWFKLGDKDLAVNLLRTLILRSGGRLSEITEMLRRTLGVKARILPMTDDKVKTLVVTEEGSLSFQEYFVRMGQRPEVRKIVFEGAEKARPLPEVLESIKKAEIIMIAPSNPIVSIGPILALPGIRDELLGTRATKIAISPIVGGKALRGPADRMMKSLGYEPTAYGVFKIYREFIDVMVVDKADPAEAEKIMADGCSCLVLDTVMRSREESRRLAREILTALRKL